MHDDLTLSDLGFDLHVPPARGRRAAAVTESYVRDLNASDILLLISNPSLDVKTPSLLKLKTSHHKLARLLAEGTSQVDASAITGYSQSRISILKNDPAFCELMEYYAGIKEQVYLDVHERLKEFSLNALEELQDRMEEAPEEFTVNELIQMVEKGFDRAGYGPKSTTVHQHQFDASDVLEAVKREVEAKRNGRIKTLDVTPNSPEDRGSISSAPLGVPTLVYSSESTPRGEGGGTPVREESIQVPPKEEL